MDFVVWKIIFTTEVHKNATKVKKKIIKTSIYQKF